MTVLVTGGSGFLASWCIRELIDQGYDVRTTVRDPTRHVSSQVPVVRADLGSDDGWAEAVDGCEYVLHVASPFPRTEPKDAEEELIRPARDGALRVLRAAFDAGVKRVVLTSSSSTTGHDETQWTDVITARPYVRSKILAEQAAWDLVAERGIRDRLVTIAPSAMLGPVLGSAAFSVSVVSRLLTGQMPGLPRLGFSFVDVRDVAALHVRAMREPAAGGRRFLADAGFLWFAEVADVLRSRLGSLASKVPTRKLPDFAVRIAAMFDRELRQVVGDLGKRTTHSTEAARTTLGWRPRPLDDTITDCAESLLK